MSEIPKSGIWRMGNITLMALTEKMILVSVPKSVNQGYEAIAELIRRTYGTECECFITQGKLSYQALAEFEPLINLIDDRIAQVNKANVSGIRKSIIEGIKDAV